MPRKISKGTNPEVSGRYLVFYIPHKEYGMGRWEFARWDVNDKRWYMYIPTASVYIITHWQKLPEKPNQKFCKKGYVHETDFTPC